MSDVEPLQVPGCLRTPAGHEAVRAVARERWAVYMRHSNDRVLERLGASLVIVGAHMRLEPWRWTEAVGTRKEDAIAAWERRRAKARELAGRCRRAS